MAFALYMQDRDLKDSRGKENQPSEDFLNRSNDYMAEAVLAALDADAAVAGEMESDLI